MYKCKWQVWNNCRKLLNPHVKEDVGKADMISRVLDLDEDAIEPEVAAMAKELVGKYSLEDVNRQSAEVAAFFTWSTEVLKRLEQRNRVGSLPAAPTDEEDRLAFRKERQKQLLGDHEEKVLFK